MEERSNLVFSKKEINVKIDIVIRLIRIPYTDYNILNREYLISKIPEIQNEIKLSGNSDQA